MNPNREEALFVLALEKPVDKRAAFLDAMCDGDAALRGRLEALLAAHEAEDGLLAEPAPAAKGTMKIEFNDAPDETVGQKIGRYKILEKVGEGGCGVVYVAEQTEPVRRRVALKVIKLGMDTKQVVARFEAERQALAMMDHPNIAKVLDAGTTETGRPFFVMELVRGIRITEYCDKNNLTTQKRLDLFISVCHAIQHAHQKGIIHRDIKPSNILVTLHDGVPVPKVIDFGIAKATEGRLTDATVYTQLHQFIGTPAYMSPEQAEMSGLDIDTRSDIYSLGVLLYELLAGSTPFDGQELMASGIDGMRKTIREKEPVRPSTRVATLGVEELTTTAKRRSADTSKLLHQLKGDLDWIVMKCLEKDRTRRYETANGLAFDLKRHLSNEPVLARPPSAAYKFQKAFRRNKLVFAAGTAIAAALVLGVIGTSIGLVRAERERRAAQEAQRLAEQRFGRANQFVHDVFQKVAPEFQGLIGAAKANETLAQISVTFVQSLGEASSTDETYQASLADLYLKLSDALGSVYSPNALGDYGTALQYANQSLAIYRNLLNKHPTDKELQRLAAVGEQRVGTLLQVSGEYDEALVHMQRWVEKAAEILKANPADAYAIRRVRVAHLHYASVLSDQGHYKEALEQYLRYGKEWLEHPVPMSANPTNDEVMWSYVEQWVVGMIYSDLDQPSEALPLYEQALQWNKLFSDCEPNNARWPRDWCELHGDLGKTQIALGRFDEGMTNLQVAVNRVESLVLRDPANGLSQSLLANLLQEEGKGWMKLAGSPEISRARQAELWQRAIAALTRAQEKQDSPQLAHRPKSQLAKKRTEIESALSEARNGYAKIADETKPDSSIK
jgi:tetratricopeptide (TPR) repeat protein/tRNA A-37 threonylcarbamoyl transferase component Bud32